MACNRNDDNSTIEPSIGIEYYPITVGATRIYTVDSIAYDDNGPTQAIDTFHYQYKEQIAEPYTDDVGNTAYLIQRYFRPNDSSSWSRAGNFTVQLANQKIQRVEEGTRLVKLVFPLRNRLSWNGNIYNNRDPQLYRVTGFKVPYLFQSTTYNSVEIEESNVVNFIEEIVKRSVYAEGVGLVHYQYDSLNTQTTGTKGFRYKLNLQAYTP